MLAIEYHVHICQVSPQLSCGDTSQIWMWYKESNRYFCRIKILLTEKLTNRAFVTPTPGLPTIKEFLNLNCTLCQGMVLKYIQVSSEESSKGWYYLSFPDGPKNGFTWAIVLGGAAGLAKYIKSCGVDIYNPKQKLHQMGSFDHYHRHVGPRREVKPPPEYWVLDVIM